jgi:glutamate racemase
VDARAAQLFVALAEEGLSEGPIAESVARHYLDGLFGGSTAEEGQPTPDTLVLGCTHFPVLAPAIRAAVGPRVEIVDSADTTARAVRAQLAASGMTCTSGAGAVRFIATDGAERFARVGGRFLGRAILPDEVELIDL